MNLNKSTRYALYAAMEMAREPDRPVTVAEVAARYRIAGGVLAKAFQQLVRAGLAAGTRGSGGGYRLARPASEVTVLDILEALQPTRTPGECLLAGPGGEACADLTLCRLRDLLDEVDELARATFASVTLDTLVGRRGRADRPRAAGHGR
jgi:Rrf2 family protein